jgi:hypothetical protein
MSLRYHRHGFVNFRKYQEAILQSIFSVINDTQRYASPQIASPQIFVINSQIANLQISTKYCTTLSQKVLKVVFLYDFL